MTAAATIHAGAVLLGEAGVLVRGASGSGKSSLLLALLDRDPTARLVADDRVALSSANGLLIAAAPPGLAGLIEIRGHGIVRRPFVSPVVLRLVVDLLPPEECERMPDSNSLEVMIEDVRLPLLRLPIGAADGALRVLSRLAGLATKPL
jgi:serine kinase of HPr protein (carbohydrate metabolism regulator)